MEVGGTFYIQKTLNFALYFYTPPAGVRAAFGTEQLAGGVEAGIEGAIHAVRLQWVQHSQEEDWGFIPIDAQNSFNEENQTAMLWAVRHEWPSGAQFTFN